MSKILGINSLFKNFDFLIYQSDNLSKLIFKSFENNNNELNIEVLESFLDDDMKLLYSDFEYIFFINGPGSFMKIRNICSYFLGLLFASNKSLKILNFNLFELYDHYLNNKNKIIFLNGFSENSLFFKNYSSNRYGLLHFNEINSLDIDDDLIYYFQNIQIYEKFLEYDKPAKNKHILEKNINLLEIGLSMINLKKFNDSHQIIKPFYIFEPEFKKI